MAVVAWSGRRAAILRPLLGAVLAWLASGPAAWAQAPAAGTAVIFAYSRFGDDDRPEGSVAMDQFESHLAELKNGGYRVLALADVAAALAANRPLPPRAVVLTIDDADLSVYTRAWPRLRALGWPVTLFVSTDTIDRGADTHMSWDQIRELARAGVAIGNATASYAHLAGQDDAYVLGQIERASDRIEAEVGRRPTLFAYPFGEVLRRVQAQLAGLGITGAVGLQSGVVAAGADRFTLPRFPLVDAYASIERFRLAAQAQPLPVTDISPEDAISDSNPPTVGFTVDPAVGSIDQLACFVSGLGRASMETIGRRVELRLPDPLPPGRARVNCTLPMDDGRWRWFGLQVTVS